MPHTIVEGPIVEPTDEDAPMSAEYVPLALIMFAFTYPSRAVGLLAPAIDRLPRPVLDYLQLVGPAVLTALAAVDVMVGVDNGESVLTIGLPWLSVGVCLLLVAWRKNLFIGLAAAVLIAIARAGRRPELGRSASGAPARLGLDLDEQRRLDQPGDLDERRGRPDVAEQLAVDGGDRRGVVERRPRRSASGRRRPA